MQKICEGLFERQIVVSIILNRHFNHPSSPRTPLEEAARGEGAYAYFLCLLMPWGERKQKLLGQPHEAQTVAVVAVVAVVRADIVRVEVEAVRVARIARIRRR